jgi:hypothetical protein
LEPYGTVRAHHEPEEMVDPENAGPNTPERPGGAKPWVRWNGEWFNRFTDPSSGEPSDANGNPIEIMQARDEYNGNLLMTGRNSGVRNINGSNVPSPHLNYLQSSATDYTDRVPEPAAVEKIKLSSIQTGVRILGDSIPILDAGTPPEYESTRNSALVETVTKGQGMRTNEAVTYLFIPVSDRQEAGPWAYFSVVADQSLPSSVNEGDIEEDYVYVQPKISVRCNGVTDHVEVYRTRTWRSRGNGFPIRQPNDLNFYRIGKVSTVSSLGTFDFSDTRNFAFLDQSYVPYEAVSKSDNDLVKTEGSLPSSTLDRKINAWTYESVEYLEEGDEFWETQYTVEFGPPKHPGANAIFMDGRSRMIMGGVEWPTKPPQMAFAVRDSSDNSSGPTRKVAYKYTPTRQTDVYGPTTTLQYAGGFQAVWQGESSLHTYAIDSEDNQFKHTRSFTVGSSGVYPRTNGDPPEGGGFLSSYPTYGRSLSDEPIQEFVYEPELALMSERFRPMEVLMEDQFTVPDGQTIRAIEPSRLAEEESVANYSFYVFTEEGVYVVNREDDQARLRNVTTVGVETYRVDFTSGTRPEYEYPLVCPTKYGTAYIGTDHRVYLLNGRKFQAIDQKVPNIWWSDLGAPAVSNSEFQAIYNEYSDVWSEQTTDDSGNTVEFQTLTPYDIAYSKDENNLYVVTYNDVWVFDFDRKDWIGNYNRTGATSLGYMSIHNSVMLHRYEDSGETYELLNEDGPPIEDNSFVTNPLLRRPQETKIRSVQTDYDPQYKEGTATWAGGSSQISLSAGTFDQSDVGATIFIPGGAEGGKNFTGIITNVINATTADLSDSLGSAPANPDNVRWFPLSTIRQQATGDHYNVYDSGGVTQRNEKVYTARPRRKKYPGINGSGHVIRFENFRSFKSMQLVMGRFD